VKKILPVLIFLLVTAAATAFIYKDMLIQQATGPDGQTAERQGGGGGGGRRGGRRRAVDPNRPVAVLVEAAKSESVPVYLQGVGTVQASNTVNVRPQVSGRLMEVNVREGQDVKAGDVLAKIDPVTYQAAYDQAVAKKAMTEAQLANARQDLARFENLAKSTFGTQKDLDTQKSLVAQYEAQTRQDQAAIDNTKANLDYTTIRAPLDGRTGIRVVDEGNIVGASDSLTYITQIKPIDVLFTLPETYVGELLAAQAAGKVALTASVGGETIGEGALSVIDNRIDEATGTVKLKGSFPNDPVKLWPGQFVNIRLHLKTLNSATVVPAVAVQQGSASRFVYLATPENTAKRTDVKIVQEDENQAVISEGIKPGDKVITTGFVSIQEGSKITLGGPDAGAPEQPGAQPGAENAPPEGQRRGRRRQNQAEGGAAERAPTDAAPTATTEATAPQAQPRQAQ
jgi:membrane fusion protein, multidrug efflux system